MKLLGRALILAMFFFIDAFGMEVAGQAQTSDELFLINYTKHDLWVRVRTHQGDNTQEIEPLLADGGAPQNPLENNLKVFLLAHLCAFEISKPDEGKDLSIRVWDPRKKHRPTSGADDTYSYNFTRQDLKSFFGSRGNYILVNQITIDEKSFGHSLNYSSLSQTMFFNHFYRRLPDEDREKLRALIPVQ